MSLNEPIQKRMYRDIHDRELFAQAHEQAMSAASFARALNEVTSQPN